MNYLQWIVFFIIFSLLFNKASRVDAFILFVAYIIYELFIVNLDATYYYSFTALLNLCVGLALHNRNNNAAICSYTLVPWNVVGYYIWYAYYDPDIYDNMSLVILLLQLMFVIPKRLLNGLRNNIKHTMAEYPIFNGDQTRVTMHKSQPNKKN